MSEMLERVARALYDQEAERSAKADRIIAAARGQPVGQPSIEPYEECADAFRADARAAIEAMREPTEAMVAAAWVKRSSLDEAPTPGATFALMWRAMIDASLPDPAMTAPGRRG